MANEQPQVGQNPVDVVLKDNRNWLERLGSGLAQAPGALAGGINQSLMNSIGYPSAAVAGHAMSLLPGSVGDAGANFANWAERGMEQSPLVMNPSAASDYALNVPPQVAEGLKADQVAAGLGLTPKDDRALERQNEAGQVNLATAKPPKSGPDIFEQRRRDLDKVADAEGNARMAAIDAHRGKMNELEDRMYSSEAKLVRDDIEWEGKSKKLIEQETKAQGAWRDENKKLSLLKVPTRGEAAEQISPVAQALYVFGAAMMGYGGNPMAGYAAIQGHLNQIIDDAERAYARQETERDRAFMVYQQFREDTKDETEARFRYRDFLLQEVQTAVQMRAALTTDGETRAQALQSEALLLKEKTANKINAVTARAKAAAAASATTPDYALHPEQWSKETKAAVRKETAGHNNVLDKIAVLKRLHAELEGKNPNMGAAYDNAKRRFTTYATSVVPGLAKNIGMLTGALTEGEQAPWKARLGVTDGGLADSWFSDSSYVKRQLDDLEGEVLKSKMTTINQLVAPISNVIGYGAGQPGIAGEEAR